MTQLAESWNERGVALIRDYQRTGDPRTAAASIELFRRAVEATPSDDASREMYLSNLGGALTVRFADSRQLEDIDSAIDAYRQAVDLYVDDDGLRAVRLSSLGHALVTRFVFAKRTADIDEGIALLTEAVTLVPLHHTDRGRLFCDLGAAFSVRYGSTHRGQDADGAVRALSEAVRSVPAGHPDRSRYALGLQVAINTRQNHDRVAARSTDAPSVLHHGDIPDETLDRVISNHGVTGDAGSAEGPQQTMALSVLGDALRMRFQRRGNPDDLDESITTCRKAVQSAPPGRPERVICLSGLGIALAIRFGRTRQTEAIDEAIAAFREAACLTPAGDPDRAARLSNLGTALQHRLERDPRPEDLDESIAAHREAVRLTPGEDPNQAGRLSNLANALMRRFERDLHPQDMDELIALKRQALHLIPPGNLDRPGAFANLGTALARRYEYSRHPEDLDESVANLRQAVDLTGVEAPDGTFHLFGLAGAVAQMAEARDAGDLLEESIASYRTVCRTGTAPAWLRTQAGARWGRLAADHGQASTAVEGLAAAVTLLGEVAWRGLRRDDQENVLTQFDGLGRDAAAWAVHTGREQYAVELLEQGRGVLLAQTVDARTDYYSLRRRAPRLAARLAEATEGLAPGRLLAMPQGSGDQWLSIAGEEAQRRNDLARQRDYVLTEIRRLDGFADFLLPPSFDALKEAAAGGPVIIVNTSRYRCDALILTQDGVHVTPLPNLTVADITRHVRGLVSGLRLTPSRGEKDSDDRDAAPLRFAETPAETLGWLWDSLAEPVLEYLDFTHRPGPANKWPRVWWCPTGLLAFLPLHAAGHHDTRGAIQPATVMDRVVSSYTPTLRALRYARQRPTLPGKHDGPVVVGLPSTRGQSDLPGVAREIDDLRARFPHGQFLIGADATRQAVLDALPDRPWVHFACHGTQNIQNPQDGQLVLHDAPLMIRDIGAMHLQQGELAFLSACQTARGGVTIADEAVTLTAGLQLAGYRHVIGTLWNIADSHAPDIANDVYARISANRGAESGTSGTAHALHAAVHNLRARFPDDPMVWAAFVHTGP